MIHLAGGNFTMGSDKESADEKPAHEVRISAFLIDAHEVTHEMFAKAELPNPSHWQEHPQMPVEQVRWRDARRYCNERSLMEELTPCYDESKPGWPCDFDTNGYRLPTEAEWEFACRAGGSGRYGFGDTGKLKQYAWFDANSGERTHPAGSRKPNAWGIFDMYGNVSEWCEDIYAPDYSAKKSRRRSRRTGRHRRDVRQARHAWRQLEVQRRDVPGHLPKGPNHRRFRCLLQY